MGLDRSRSLIQRCMSYSMHSRDLIQHGASPTIVPAERRCHVAYSERSPASTYITFSRRPLRTLGTREYVFAWCIMARRRKCVRLVCRQGIAPTYQIDSYVSFPIILIVHVKARAEPPSPTGLEGDLDLVGSARRPLGSCVPYSASSSRILDSR